MLDNLLQPTHLLIVLAIALLVLGPKRLPEVGRSLGRSIADFRSGLSGFDQPPAGGPSAPESPPIQASLGHAGPKPDDD